MKSIAGTMRAVLEHKEEKCDSLLADADSAMTAATFQAALAALETANQMPRAAEVKVWGRPDGMTTLAGMQSMAKEMHAVLVQKKSFSKPSVSRYSGIS